MIRFWRLINLLNGTFEIDGCDMKLRKPERDDFLTYQLLFKYDENAECPMFDEYLNTVLPDKNNPQIVVSVDMLDTGIDFKKKHSPK